MHCSCGVSHFLTYIANIPQLLHILITLLGLLGLFLTLVALCTLPPAPPPSLSSKAWASQDNAMLRQSDRKCLKSFLAGTGENQRDFKGVSQKQADAAALCCTPPYTGIHRLIHLCTHIQTATHGLAVTHIQWHAAHSERIWGKKTNTHNPLSLCPTPQSLNITSLTAPLVPSRASSY